MSDKLFKKGDFEKIYKDISSDTPLLEILTDCYKDFKTSEMAAGDKARETILEVARYYNIQGMVLRGESDEILDEFLECLGDKIEDEKARKEYLHQLNFNFGMYQSEDIVKEIHYGKSTKSLFDDYISNPENRNLTEEEIKTSIKNRLSSYPISSKNMKKLVKMFENSDVIHYTSTLVGKNSERFKCIIAAYIYKNANGKISIPEAVGLASTAVDIENIADAVAIGIETREKARKIIGALLIALCVALIVYVICNGGIAAVISGIGNLVKRLALAFAEMQWVGATNLILDAGVFSIESFKFFPFVASLVSIVIGGALVKKTYKKIVDFIGEKAAKLVYLDDEEYYEESDIAKGFKEFANNVKETFSVLDRHRESVTNDVNKCNIDEERVTEKAKA